MRISQQPNWPNQEELLEVLNELNNLPALVFSEETRKLRQELVEAELGNSFVLQMGDCAESFKNCNGPYIHDYLRIFNLLTLALDRKLTKKIIRIGRFAGQYAKPRSSEYEVIDDVKLVSYKGDNVNSATAEYSQRMPNPRRLVEGYFRAGVSLNLLRAFNSGSYNSSNNLNDWQLNYINSSEEFAAFLNEYYFTISDNTEIKNFGSIYTSHEALLLQYENCFTRVDTVKGGLYNCGAHFLWLGERTRYLDSEHVSYLSKIENPVGVKVGPSTSADELNSILQRLNPSNLRGKIILIFRLGAINIDSKLPFLLDGLQDRNCTLMVDPMHGNTRTVDGRKTRLFDDILNETNSFGKILKSKNLHFGGIHLELTAEAVTECVGGFNSMFNDNLEMNYVSDVDPRLNGAQGLDLISKVDFS